MSHVGGRITLLQSEEFRGETMMIGYISLGDPRRRGTWSGTPNSIFQSLSRDHQVEWINPGGLNTKTIYRYHKVIGKLTGRTVRPYSTLRFASAVGRNLRKHDLSKYDLLFSIGSTEIANLDTTVPIVHLTDATFAQMVGYYDGFDMGEKRNRHANEIQRKAYEVSTQIIFASAWAARSAMNDYHVPEEKINVVRFGANQDVPDRLPERQGDGTLRMLFVGKEWVRKGGSIAVDALTSLQDRGIDAELVMVGCDAPRSVPNMKGLTIIPYVEDVSTYFREADIFILPTRAECAGIVFCEASAYGLPSFTTATGGVPDYVEDGVTGRLLPPDARGEDFADAIAELWSDPETMKEMRLNARRRYEEELNWDVWMKHFEEIVEKVLTASRA